MGDDATMLKIVASVKVAFGGHASDPATMFQTLALARDNGVNIGAHTGFNDREGFGRRVIPMSPSEMGRMCAAQIGALIGVAAQAGTPVAYLKPHGALANLAARDRDVTDAIVDAIQQIDPKLAVLAISGTQTEHAAGFSVFSEIFADRGYLSSGQLVSRGQDGAMIHDAGVAAARLIAFLDSDLMPVADSDPIKLAAHSICVHGDSAGAVAMAREVRARLTAEGIVVPHLMSV